MAETQQTMQDTVPVTIDSAFAEIANADIEKLLKQLTQDEKVALLSGKCNYSWSGLYSFN